MYIEKNEKKIYFQDYTKFWDRLKGLMFVLEPIQTGIRFPHCNSIHTYFMCQRIDIIMTDKDHKIIKMYPNFKSEKIILPKRKVYYTYELPLSTCQLFTIGETISIKE